MKVATQINLIIGFFALVTTVVALITVYWSLQPAFDPQTGDYSAMVQEYRLVRRQVMTNLFLSLGSTILIGAFAADRFINLRVSRRLTQLTQQVQTISQGNLERRVKLIHGRANDEINQLASACDQMRKQVRHNIETLEQQIKERTKELNQKIRQLERFKQLTVDTELYSEQVRQENLELKRRLALGKSISLSELEHGLVKPTSRSQPDNQSA